MQGVFLKYKYNFSLFQDIPPMSLLCKLVPVHTENTNMAYLAHVKTKRIRGHHVERNIVSIKRYFESLNYLCCELKSKNKT